MILILTLALLASGASRALGATGIASLDRVEKIARHSVAELLARHFVHNG